MKRRDGRRVCLGFQWNADSWDGALSWCDSIVRKFDRQRLHWNLPAFPPDGQTRKRASLVRMIRGRLEESGDVITSAGFAGACHPLLNLDELEKELGWGLKNPWGTGVTDVLEVRPTILIAPMPDLVRPDAGKLYRAHGFTHLGIPAATRVHPEAVGAGAFSYILVPVARCSGDLLARVLRKLNAAGDDMAILLELSGLDETGPLEQVLEECAAFIAGPGGTGFSLIEELTPPAPTGRASNAAAPRGCHSDWSAFPAPILRAKLAAAEALTRKKRKKTEEYRDLLTLLGPGKPPLAEIEVKPKESPSRLRLVAHMLGDVALSGSDFDVHLVGGRFCGITRRGADLLPRRPAVSSMMLAGKTMSYRTQSSFSFEGENGTGLREELALDGGKGTLSIEYSFQDDSPLLRVSGEIRHPHLETASTVEEYAPFAISLAEIARGATVEVEVAAPDESVYTARLSEGRGWMLLPGSSYRIRCAASGAIRIRFSLRDGRRWGLPFFRIVRARGRRHLECNPFGSYAPVPAAALSDRRESFSLFLGLEAG